MTREEAISVLSANVMFACDRALFDIATKRCVEDALDMAIEALQEQKKGKWIIEIEEEHTEKYDARIPHWFCSCCRTEYDPYSATLINYCSNCGAKMEA